MIKTIALGLLVVVSLALGGALYEKTKLVAELTSQKGDADYARLAEQQGVAQQAKDAAAQSEQKRAQLAARNKAAKQALLDARTAAASTPAASTGDSPSPAKSDDGKKKPTNPFSESIAKMMKDPAMKNMVRNAQATVLKQMHADLVKQWSLSPEETQTFYDLLLDKQMDQMDQGMKLFENGSDTTKTADVGDPDAKTQSVVGRQSLQAISGLRKDDSRAVYRLPVPAATCDQQHAHAATQLNRPRCCKRSPRKPRTCRRGITDRRRAGNGNILALDPAQVDQFIKSQGELNDRIDARMAGTISAEQLQALKDQQQQMLSTQRMGMEMAAKMMAPSPTP